MTDDQRHASVDRLERLQDLIHTCDEALTVAGSIVTSNKQNHVRVLQVEQRLLHLQRRL